MDDLLTLIKDRIDQHTDLQWMGYSIPNRPEIRKSLANPVPMNLLTYVVLHPKDPMYLSSELNGTIGNAANKINLPLGDDQIAVYNINDEIKFLSLPSLVYSSALVDGNALTQRLNIDPIGGKTVCFDCIPFTGASKLQKMIVRDQVKVALYPSYATAYAALANSASCLENRFNYLGKVDLQHTETQNIDSILGF